MWTSRHAMAVVDLTLTVNTAASVTLLPQLKQVSPALLNFIFKADWLNTYMVAFWATFGLALAMFLGAAVLGPLATWWAIKLSRRHWRTSHSLGQKVCDAACQVPYLVLKKLQHYVVARFAIDIVFLAFLPMLFGAGLNIVLLCIMVYPAAAVLCCLAVVIFSGPWTENVVAVMSFLSLSLGKYWRLWGQGCGFCCTEYQRQADEDRRRDRKGDDGSGAMLLILIMVCLLFAGTALFIMLVAALYFVLCCVGVDIPDPSTMAANTGRDRASHTAPKGGSLPVIQLVEARAASVSIFVLLIPYFGGAGFLAISAVAGNAFFVEHAWDSVTDTKGSSVRRAGMRYCVAWAAVALVYGVYAAATGQAAGGLGVF